MIYKHDNYVIETNLAEKSYEQLINGTWKIGLISDNDLIENDDSNYYEDYTVNLQNNKNNETKCRVLKNKVNVKLIDGSKINAHIIHWNPSNGYFCITLDSFWDQFD